MTLALRSWVWAVVLSLLVLAPAALAQQTCGDLDLDGDVDSDDALVLRHDLDESAPLSFVQSLSCDVITELRDPSLAPDPDDLSGACSMVDAGVMTRHEGALPPGPSPVCALGSSADCCAAHLGVGCNVSNTVACVCAQDPSCCTADWDATCASLACTGACEPTCSAGSDYCAGACTDVQTNPAHCGACGVTCTNPHGTTQCATGACSPTCSLGAVSCDSNPQNGCETLLDANPGCPGTFLGPIDGESSALQVTQTGRGEAQFYVQVQDTGTCFNDYTSLRARLTSPPGANYNVRLTCFNCGSNLSVTSSAPAGAVDLLSAGSFDNCPSPGDSGDDTHYVVIAILYASGTSCGDWSLELRGDENVAPSALCSGDN